MTYEENEFRIDREALQGVVGSEVEWNVEPEVILEMIKGQEVTAWVKDKNFAILKVKAIISDSTEKLPGSVRLWVENWQGVPLPKAWAIKILEIYP